MIKYKNFNRWVFTTKLNILPEADKDRVEEQATPHPQPQAAIRMLKTPIMHRSPSLPYFFVMQEC